MNLIQFQYIDYELNEDFLQAKISQLQQVMRYQRFSWGNRELEITQEIGYHLNCF